MNDSNSGIISIERLAHILQVEVSAIRVALKVCQPGKDVNATLTFSQSLLFLLCDFFRRSGMKFEAYAGVMIELALILVAYSERLSDALHIFTVEPGVTAVKIPQLFITLADNRYVSIYPRDQVIQPTEVYDMEKGQWTHRTQTSAPVFTTTVSVSALFIRTIGKDCGYDKAVEWFNRGPTLVREEHDDKKSLDY